MSEEIINSLLQTLCKNVSETEETIRDLKSNLKTSDGNLSVDVRTTILSNTSKLMDMYNDLLKTYINNSEKFNHKEDKETNSD